MRADEPVPPDGNALMELVFAGAPLVPDATGDASAGSSSNIGSPPIGPAAVPASESVPPPNVGLQPNPALPDIPVPNPLDLIGIDPGEWAGDILNAILTMIGRALLEAFRGFTDWALGLGDSSLNFVTRTPAAGTYESPTVLSLWDFSRALVNVALASVVMWGGFNIMVKEHTRSPYHEMMELLPRVILAALAANLTLEFARFLIDMNNALAASVGEVGLPRYDQATPSQEGIALIFTALAYGIVAILLVFQMLMRLALIDMLIVLSPVAALCWVLPQTQGWFRWWADIFPITVFQQAIQVMVLSLGSALMVELTPGSLSNALLTMMLGIAVCWLTLKVPSLLRSRHSQAGLFNVVTLVAATRAVGAIGGAAAGGGAGAAAGGAAAGRAAPGRTRQVQMGGRP
ncbi:MAG: conjugal transfer protein TrbL family protein [Dehalococcoidia bacterium]